MVICVAIAFTGTCASAALASVAALLVGLTVGVLAVRSMWFLVRALALVRVWHAVLLTGMRVRHLVLLTGMRIRSLVLLAWMWIRLVLHTGVGMLCAFLPRR